MLSDMVYLCVALQLHVGVVTLNVVRLIHFFLHSRFKINIVEH